MSKTIKSDRTYKNAVLWFQDVNDIYNTPDIELLYKKLTPENAESSCKQLEVLYKQSWCRVHHPELLVTKIATVISLVLTLILWLTESLDKYVIFELQTPFHFAKAPFFLRSSIDFTSEKLSLSFQSLVSFVLIFSTYLSWDLVLMGTFYFAKFISDKPRKHYRSHDVRQIYLLILLSVPLSYFYDPMLIETFITKAQPVGMCLIMVVLVCLRDF